MNRIDATFARLRQRNAKALIAYLTVGFPSLKSLPGLVKVLAEEGVDLIELGIPFSDPLADGPTIQAASQQALKQKVTPPTVLRAVEGLRQDQFKHPIVVLTYYNPILQVGIKEFCRECVSHGVDGLIVPDLPPEEASELQAAARSLQVDTIFLAAPTSPVSRLKQIARASSGFIYYVSLTGVTGARSSVSREVASQVRRIKRLSPLPVCVGFGISGPAQVREVVQVADGAIVGSALLEVIAHAPRNPIQAAGNFIRSLRRACQ